MRHYLAFHVWHARVQNFQQFSIENFMVRVHQAKVLANNFQKLFTDFFSTEKPIGSVKYRTFFLLVYLWLPVLYFKSCL